MRTIFMLPLALFIACDGEATQTGSQASSISCQQTIDCIARGGTCQAGECAADNQCTTDADCAAGVCAPDPDFGGLCHDGGPTPPTPLPMWSCVGGQDCPLGQGCASDGFCHVDGECASDGDCAAGQLCYKSADSATGICDGARPATNPYCRSDAQGACRSLCYSDGTCGSGLSCVGDFCHWDDECISDSDCSPNHLCGSYFEQGFSTCSPDPDPQCVVAPDGACRWACWNSSDCILGGGCEPDGFCHGSNECDNISDCDPGLECIPDAHFGALCGPPR